MENDFKARAAGGGGDRLTVIIPVYGRQKELDRALDSLLAQSMDFDVIIVDDASPVEITIKPVHASALNLNLVRAERNGGAAQARNIGLQNAETTWVSFLDSDDSLQPQTLASRWAFVREAQKNAPNPRVIYGCGWEDVDEAGRLLSTRHPLPGLTFTDFASGCWFCPGSCIIFNRTEVMNAAGLQDTRLRRLEDYEWFLRLGHAGFVLEVQSIIGANIERKRQVNVESVLDSVDEILKSPAISDMSGGQIRRVRAYLALEIAAANFFAGERWKAALWIAKSLFFVPRTGLHFAPGWRVVAAE